MKKLLAFLVGFFMACTAMAVPTVTNYAFPSTGYGSAGPYLSTNTAACQWGLTNRVGSSAPAPNGGFTGFTSTGTNCQMLNANGSNGSLYTLLSLAACPANSTWNGSTCACNAGSTQSGNSCVVDTNACAVKLGQSTVVNFTEGYTRTTEEGDRAAVGPVNTPPTDGVMCSAGCKVAAQTSGSGVQYYVSATPTAQGLYRRSVDMPAQHLGTTCTGTTGTTTASDSSVDPEKPAPVCPGFVGEVNGKTGCFGTAQTPVTTTSMPRPASGASSGNPAAGLKPATGDGSGSGGAGRTPAAGTGGNAGGPASAAVNPGGTGNIPKPAETEVQAECGAPGQPKCSIDENGTPDGISTMKKDDFESKLQERESALTQVTSAGGKDTSWGVMPKWTEQGVCSAWHIYTLPAALGARSVDLDLCPVKPFADGVANFIWCALAFFGITSMVFATMTSKGT